MKRKYQCDYVWLWTDDKVEMFTQIYSSNFSASVVDEDIFFYSNYKGKKCKEKINQFKNDYQKIQK